MYTQIQTQPIAVSASHKELITAFSIALHPDIISAAHRCSQRLLSVLPHKTLNYNRVFVAYGGGKDSSYMLAFVRLVQLIIHSEHQDTFQLIVATNRHSGMPSSVLQNIDNVYRAINAYNDQNVDVLLIDDDHISPFDPNQPLNASTLEKNRMDILMTGHRCEGEARPTFCNACNLSMIKSFGMIASYNGGVDVVITGDSMKEQRAYIAWTRQIATKLGISRQKEDRSFSAFLHTMNGIAQHYFQDIYGENTEREPQVRHFREEKFPRNPVFFSIYPDAAYEVAEHWDFLTGFLGFQFDELAFSFTESDCANPALMAHLRGLKTEHVYGRTYKEGIAEYTQFALELMRKKHFPHHLIEQMKTRYKSPVAIQNMRQKMDTYAQEVLNLAQEHLVCMLYSPFVEGGKNLGVYLEREQPDLCKHRNAILRLLSEPHLFYFAEEEQYLALTKRLTEISHLDIEYLHNIYHMKLSHRGVNSWDTPISVILQRDPHKGTIHTMHSPGGSVVTEMISGR